MLRFKTFISEKWRKLTPGEVFKAGREGRAEVILNKIEDGDVFVTFPPSDKVVKISAKKTDLKILEKIIKNKDRKALTNFEFISVNGKTYTISDFAKTPEFGGKGAGSGTAAEDEALYDLKKKFTKIIEQENVPYILVKLGKKTIKLAEIESTPGTPKSDFHFKDIEGNEVAWISHKKGSSSKHFQQYGGMQELVKNGLKSTEINSFIDKVNAHLEDKDMKGQQILYMPVKDKKVIMSSMWGKDFKAGGPDGRQNIDVLFQGFMKFKQIAGPNKNNIPTYEITSNHTVYHGTYSNSDGYEPVYYVRFTAGRNAFGIKNSRWLIMPKAQVRKTSVELK